MRAYEAWMRAKSGQRIGRVGMPRFSLTKSAYVSLGSEVFGIDFSTNDWEVVGERHNLTFTNTEVEGLIGGHTLSAIFRDKNLERPRLFTKVSLEWEV